MKKEIGNISEVVYPISQAVYLAQNMAEDFVANKHRAIWTGLPSVDKYVNPFFGGTLISMIGRPQNAKTFFSMYLMQNVMRKLKKEQLEKNVGTNEACVLITTEVSVEIAALQWMARVSGIPVSQVVRGELDELELERLDDSAFKVMGLPLFIIGHSSKRNDEGRRTRPALNPENLGNAIDYIINGFRDPETDSLIEPKMIVTDYLQRLHRNNNQKYESKTDFFSGCVDWSKDIALWCDCPHFLNVQAGRQVDERDVKIPKIGDGQWTSNIEQSSDVIFSTHMPKVYNIPKMKEFESWGIPELYTDKKLYNGDELIYLTLLKQKEGVGNKCFVLKGDMPLLGLEELNLDNHR